MTEIASASASKTDSLMQSLLDLQLRTPEQKPMYAPRAACAPRFVSDGGRPDSGGQGGPCAPVPGAA
jgi:hypothetical protein